MAAEPTFDEARVWIYFFETSEDCMSVKKCALMHILVSSTAQKNTSKH